MWSWRTRADEVVEVDRQGGAGFEVLSLPGADEQTARVETWEALVRHFADVFAVPAAWVRAVVYAESGGAPEAHSACCAGLMGLSLKVYGLTLAQAVLPETNVRLGTETLGKYRERGFSLPETASLFNAGGGVHGKPHPSAASPWGMREDMPAVPWTGYIEKVVRASNFWLLHPPSFSVPPQKPPPPGPPPSPPARPTVRPVLARLGLLAAGLAIGYAAVHAPARPRDQSTGKT